MDSKLQLALNAACSQATANDPRMARARALAFNPNGGLDGKRPGLWCELGYPENISNEQLIALWRRGGIAHGAVEKVIDNCWSTNPELIQGGKENESTDETEWEKKTSQVLDERIWAAFQEADRRRMVARFSALILRFRDGQDFDKPVVGKSVQLVGVIPVWSTALKPITYVETQTSDNYGQPLTWSYTPARPDGSAGAAITVHADRVFLLGSWASDELGYLEPAYNNFVNIEKIEGGSAEGLFKNSARQLNLNFDKEVDLGAIAAQYGVPIADLRSEFNKVAQDLSAGNDTLLITQGATATPLVATMPDPKATWEVNVSGASAGINVASRILIGNQSGERASTEDRAEFNGTCQSRRVKRLTPDIVRFAEHLQRFGALGEAKEISCKWDDLREPTTAEKLANAKRLAEINAAALGVGDALPFTTEEIRVAGGYEPDGAPDPMPEDPEPEEDPIDGNPPPAA